MEFPSGVAKRPTPASKYGIKVEKRDQRARSKCSQNWRESHARARACRSKVGRNPLLSQPAISGNVKEMPVPVHVHYILSQCVGETRQLVESTTTIGTAHVSLFFHRSPRVPPPISLEYLTVRISSLTTHRTKGFLLETSRTGNIIALAISCVYFIRGKAGALGFDFKKI